MYIEPLIKEGRAERVYVHSDVEGEMIKMLKREVNWANSKNLYNK